MWYSGRIIEDEGVEKIASFKEKFIIYNSIMQTGQLVGFVQVGLEKWLLPNNFEHHANEIFNFKARNDDIWTHEAAQHGRKR